METMRRFLISIGQCNIPEDENDGGDNFNGEPHEVSPANDLEDREGDTGENKNAEFDLRTVLLNDASPDYGVGYKEKADKGNNCEGESHVANQLSPNNLKKLIVDNIAANGPSYPIGFPLDVHERVSHWVAKAGRREVETLHAQFYRVHRKISVARVRD